MAVTVGTDTPLDNEVIEGISEENAQRREREAAQEARRDFLRHPVYRTLEASGAGSRPTGPELDALGLSVSGRQGVETAIAKLTSLREEGRFSDADDAAFDLAEEIVGGLPKQQRLSTYLEVEELDERGPDELADAVRRW